MRQSRLLLKMAVLVTCLLCSMSAAAAAAYACYTSSNTTLTFYYDNLRSSRTGTTYDLNTNSAPDWYRDGTNSLVTKVVFDSSFSGARPTSTLLWFGEMTNLTTITGISYLNTSQVIDMGYMFQRCRGVTTLNLSGFNTANVTSMYHMFEGCWGLTSLDLSSFNTAKVTAMGYMFSYCEGLMSLNLSSFNTARVSGMENMFSGCYDLTTLDLSSFNTANVTNMREMFFSCTHLTSLNLSSFNTANVTNMQSMFNYCNNLRTIYVGSGWNTAAVTSSTMFNSCTSLVGGMGTTYDANHTDKAYAHIDGGTSNPGYLTEWKEAYACYTSSNSTLTFYYDGQRSTRTGTTYDLNTGNNEPGWHLDNNYGHVTKVVFNSSFADARPTSTFRWFSGMNNLTSITGITYLNTSQVTNMYTMFAGCSGLTSLNVSNFNTAKVTNMANMFYGCSGLTNLNVSNFNTAKVNNMNWMFYGCSGLTSLDLSNFNTANVTNLGSMFRDCSGLTSLNVSNFNTANVTSMVDLFYGCSGLTSLDLSHFNTASVTIMNSMFCGCTNLTTIYAGSDWSTATVTNSTYMFYYCTKLVGGMGTTFDANHTDKAYAHIDGGTSNPGYFTAEGAQPWTETEAYACYTSSNTTLTFYYDNQRSTRTGTTYDLNEADNVPVWYTDSTCHSVTKVVFNSSFANDRPTTTYGWFYGMENLQSITGIAYLNTSDVTNMGYMFGYCSSLANLDLSSFNTANVTNMFCMFQYCTGLTGLNMSNFNTANVTNMGCMFYNCRGLANLDLSSFNTPKVTNMNQMFYGCSGLTSLDLSSFNTGVTNLMKYMFQSCSKLTTIYVGSGWSTDAVTSSTNMFMNCIKIVGGQGTTYDANHVDAAYAHIDGGTSNPGYFTAEGAQPWTELEAYACYTPSNTTLTFYYDNQRSTRTGTTYNLNTGTNKPVWNTDSTCRSVTRIVLDASFADARPTTTAYWFHLMENLTTIEGIEYLNTSEVTNMSSMFYKCNQLTSLDVSHFNTANVTSFASLFYNCSNLTSIDVSGFNTAKATTMYGMFYNCSKLANLNVTNFNTAYVTIMYGMFFNCSKLTSLNVTNFNTAKVTNMVAMFYNCRGLTSLDLSSFNTAKVTNMNQMIGVCDHLTTIYVGEGWSTAAVTSSNNMFLSCTSLVGGQGTTYDASHIDAAYAHIDGGTSNPGYFTAEGAQPWTETEAYACYTSSNTTLTFYYDNQRGTRTGTTYDLNTGSNNPVWYTDSTCFNVTKVVFNSSFADARPTSTYRWFSRMNKLTSFTGLNYFNTSEVTNMGIMFYNCTKLTSLDLSNFNTAKVTNMNYMFQYCTGLTSLNLSNFNTAKVTTMYAMFDHCTNLTSLDVSNFNTANVTDMRSMFCFCNALTSLDLSSFNTAKVTNMSGMFWNCQTLTSLDLSNFNTAKVENMQYMFRLCTSLTTIYADDEWSTAAVTTSPDMFINCPSLVGGQGTTYDADHVDAAYAHIDGGTSNPGYFTDINAPTEPEAYVCYTPSDSTLTFYYDTQRSTRQGTTYDLNTVNNDPDWYTDNTCYNVAKVVFNSSFAGARPTSTFRWFSGMNKLTSIVGWTYLNTSEVKKMNSMFYNCTKLTSIDVSGFNTANVTDMGFMFQNCTSLTSIDVSNFNTDKLISMYCMFDNCPNLTSLDVTNFNTANVAIMNYVFSNCRGLTSLDLSNFNTAQVENMQYMFNNCSELTTIYVGSGWTTDAVTSSGNMFYNCAKLVGGKGTTYDANHVDKAYAHIDGGTSNPGYLTDINAPTEPEAYSCYTASNTTLTFYYDTERSTREGTTYDLNAGMDDPGWDLDGSYLSVTQVVFDPSFADARPTSTSSWFWGMINLQSITGMDCMNTEDVTTMWSMFFRCSSLTVLDLSNFNTSKVTNMLSMFADCSNLTTIYAGEGWSMATVSVNSNMFTNCTKLVGGKGTAYNPNYTNGFYAHIDGGPSNPGYFTEKVDFILGDVNGDGDVTIADVTMLISMVLKNNSSASDCPAGDLNTDGNLTIADVTMLISRVLRGY